MDQMKKEASISERYWRELHFRDVSLSGGAELGVERNSVPQRWLQRGWEKLSVAPRDVTDALSGVHASTPAHSGP